MHTDESMSGIIGTMMPNDGGGTTRLVSLRRAQIMSKHAGLRIGDERSIDSRQRRGRPTDEATADAYPVFLAVETQLGYSQRGVRTDILSKVPIDQNDEEW